MATAIQFLRSSTTNLRPDPVTLEDGMPMLNYNPADPGLYFAAEDDTLLKVGPTHVGDTAPNAGAQGFAGYAVGEQWLDTSAGNSLKTWGGTSWLATSVALSGDSLINDGDGIRLNENSTDFATFPRDSSGDGYNLSGNIGFGTASPTHKVSIYGGMRLMDQGFYPAGELGALAVVGATLLYHNGTAWIPVIGTGTWQPSGNDTFYDQGDVFIGSGSPGSPPISLTSTGAASFASEVTTTGAFTYINPDAGGELDVIGIFDSGDGTKTGQTLGIKSNGTVGVGGTPATSPNIELKPDGSGTFTGSMSFTGLPSYADDAAAGAGGLTAGDVYKTATGELRIKL